MVVLDFVDLAADDPERERMYSEHLYCPYDDLSFEELEPRSFSFNSPFGACPDCTGIGTRMEVDPELIIPDEDKSLDEGAVSPWSLGHTKDYFARLVGALADELGFRTDIPWAGLPQRAKKALLHGHKTQIEVRYRNRYGRERAYTTSFEGAVPFVKRRHSEAESDGARERFEGYMREVPCPTCEGTRLKPLVLAVTVMERSIAEVSAMSISDCADFLAELKLNNRDKKIAERVLKEVNERLKFLVDVGLDYLSLNRAAGDALRRRGPAHPARHPDRLRPGRRALRPGRAVDRAPPARQPPPDRDARTPSGHGQHPDRRRARRGHHQGGRLGRRHRPRRR